MTNQNRRARRVAIAVVLATGTTGVAALPLVGSEAERPASGEVVPSVSISAGAAKYIDTQAVMAAGQAGGRSFVLAPGRGSLYRPTAACLTVATPGVHEVALTCSYTREFETKGALTRETSGTGRVRLWGILPAGATPIRSKGMTLDADGRFFFAEAPHRVRGIAYRLNGKTKHLAAGSAASR